jgi:hypothetical protein
MKARQQQEFAKRWVGVVEVKTGDSVAKFTAVETFKDGKRKLFPGDVESLKFKIAELPKAAQRVIKPGMDTSKRFRVRLSEDADEVETVTPVSGVFRARAVGLGPKTQDGEYRLIHKVYKEGTKDENRHEEFLAIYEITEGVFRGVELPGFYLHYKFEEDPENEGLTQFNTANTPQAKQLHKLISWAEVHGDILEADVRWLSEEDGTILGELEERILENDREVNLVFENGWIQTVQAVEDYEESEDDDEEEKPAPKKTTRKNVSVKIEEEELPDFLKDEKPAKKKSPAKAKVSDPDDDL